MGAARKRTLAPVVFEKVRGPQRVVPRRQAFPRVARSAATTCAIRSACRHGNRIPVSFAGWLRAKQRARRWVMRELERLDEERKAAKDEH